VLKSALCVLLMAGTCWGQNTPATTTNPSNATAAKSASALTAKQELLWQKMAERVSRIAQHTDGVLGVVVKDLTSGKELAINADEVYPTASSIKIAVLAELYRQSQQGGPGKAKLSDQYVVNAADLVEDSYIMGGLTPGVTRLTNRDLATMMVAVSDNSATNVLMDRVGMDNVNAMLDSLGLTHTRLRRKMMDIKAAQQGRENVATPRELASLLEQTYAGKVLNKENTADFFKMLSTPKDSSIPKLLPDTLRIANKPGELAGVRNDVGIVFVKDRPFIVSVMGTYLRDERAGARAISEIALAAYEYFDIVGAASDLGRVISPLNSR
jgi:beta-lactamase class A